ncbi:MAG: phytanoyl-CoA dioxygenase, partial [Pedobacter sp.]
SQLYGGKNVVPNTEKLSYNPPENTQYRFAGSPLHWDIDFNSGIQYHIQGLIYLNDVPAKRGALTLIQGFHHEIETFLAGHPSPEVAIEKLRTENRQIAIAGKKGDLIVWLEALPHAASPNQSDQPRFVQYVSFGVL